MSAKIESLKGCLDRQEQYSRWNFLLIHGLPESKNDNTDELVLIQLKRRWDKKSKRMK